MKSVETRLELIQNNIEHLVATVTKVEEHTSKINGKIADAQRDIAKLQADDTSLKELVKKNRTETLWFVGVIFTVVSLVMRFIL